MRHIRGMTRHAGAMPALRTFTKQLARTADLVRRPSPGLVVLIYHRVGSGTTSEVDLDVGVFDEQLAWLREHSEVVSLDTAIQTAGARPQVAITFDDGTADFVDHALPLLVRHGLPATLYVATRFVDEGQPFPRGAPPASWQGLRDAHATGLVVIGSHTHDHLLLDRLDAPAAANDIDRSIALIEDNIGASPGHFAYPKAVDGSPAVQALVRERFVSAALAGTRPNRLGDFDAHRLARSPIQRSDAMGYFRRKVAGGMRLEDDLRRLLNRRRYAELTR